MAIKGKSIRSVEKILAQARGVDQVRFAVEASAISADMLAVVGFDDPLTVGDHILPSGIGKHTLFNADGCEIVRRDLPMESHSVSSYRNWKDWHGQDHSGIQHRDVQRYPRETVLPPGEELEIIDVGGRIYISTRPIALSNETEGAALHLANVVLECFRQFDVLDARSGVVVQAHVRNLGWEILPRGKYPWAKAAPILRDITRTLGPATQPVVEERLQTISAHQPSFLAKGRGGFVGYVVLGFPDKGIFVLESCRTGNATYIFTEGWEFLSQLTKAEIIQGNLAKHRIIHGRKWRGLMHSLLSGL
jgi:hypothetical protein